MIVYASCRLPTSVKDGTELISLKTYVAKMQFDSILLSWFSWRINENTNHNLESICRYISFNRVFTLIPPHNQRIQEPSWLSKRLCTTAVTIFPRIQNENMRTTNLKNFMPLLQVRTWKCHATNRHYVVRFADSAIRIPASFPTIQSSQGNKALATPWTNINVKWDKCFIKNITDTRFS
jgi:hypothetical protein